MSNTDSSVAAQRSQTGQNRPERRIPIRKLRKGITIVYFAVFLIVIICFIALSVEVGQMMVTRSEVQAAADAGSLAGVSGLYVDSNEGFNRANEYVQKHGANGTDFELEQSDFERGIYDENLREFTANNSGNAVKVTVRSRNNPLRFGRFLGVDNYDRSSTAVASSVAKAHPRDIVFVIDLSGSMNDDAEPCWATQTINGIYPGVGTQISDQLLQDFGFGSASLQYLGEPLGVAPDEYAYAEMTKDNGPLANPSLSSLYRINPGDDEQTRKIKAYSWIIDNQIAVTMPNAQPTPDSTQNYAYWARYLDYLILQVTIVPPPPPPPPPPPGGDDGGSSGGDPPPDPDPDPPPPDPDPPPNPDPPPPPLPPPPSPPAYGFDWKAGGFEGARRTIRHALLSTSQQGVHDERVQRKSGSTRYASHSLFVAHTGRRGAYRLAAFMNAIDDQRGRPPENRGTIPPDLWGKRITGFNNPNIYAYSNGASASGFYNLVGPATYAQFMLDHGRDGSPDGVNNVPLALSTNLCPLHSEQVKGQNYSFPPSCQPVHAVRRSLISALVTVKQANGSFPDVTQSDQVAVIAFDKVANGAQTIHELSVDYDEVIDSCLTLQAVSDEGRSTAAEVGLIAAKDMLRPVSEGGLGRAHADQIVVLLTDGMPNDFTSSENDIDSFIANNPDPDFYGGGYYWLDAPLMQVYQLAQDEVLVYAAGIGVGCDYDFMDRVARMGKTDEDGVSLRASGDPQVYEQELTAIFEKIIQNPRVRLVE